MYICLLSKFQLDILKDSQDMVNLMSNTLQTTVQHKTLAGENFGGFGGFPVNRQSFIHQIL